MPPLAGMKSAATFSGFCSGGLYVRHLAPVSKATRARNIEWAAVAKLDEYKRKRRFGGKGTPEPSGEKPAKSKIESRKEKTERAERPRGSAPRPGRQDAGATPDIVRDPTAKAAPEPTGEYGRFVVQKHSARRLHYDLRLEVEGVMKSWAVPKGPTLNPGDKRLAVMTEDHPLDYQHFEGKIPEGHYGAGTVMVWDRGLYELMEMPGARKHIARGEVKFQLFGEKLRGGFALVKLKHSEKGNEWLLIKHKDHADPKYNIDEHDGSALTGRMLDEISAENPPKRARRPIHPTEVSNARRAAMPAKLEPMLAQSAEQPFSDPAWIFEIKWDGVRALVLLNKGKYELRSRNARTITSQYPELAELPGRILARQAVLDGEVVALDERGRGDFERLQERMHNSSPSPQLLAKSPVTLYLFDLLWYDGYDLCEAPLVQRKELLRCILKAGERIRFCDHHAEQGKELFELARQHGLEGIVAKRAESTYTSGRVGAWLKIKSRSDLDAVVAGWTEPRGAREHFGALIIGLYEGRKLRCVGQVGSGFDAKTLQKIIGRLKKLQTPKCPFDTLPETNEKPCWAEPQLVARVEYSGWTQEQRLRHPVFLGLRDDKQPAECVFAQPPAEKAMPATVTAPAIVGRILSKKSQIEDELFRGKSDNVTIELDGKRVRCANLNKVFFPESGYTKRDLLAYYYRVAEYVLPFLKDRPLVLRRYPDGISGMSFFQKDTTDAGVAEWVDTVLVPSEHRGDEIRFVIASDTAALLHLTNLGCIDHNPWSSRRYDLEHPDYFFYDLDPADGTEFSVVMTIAKALADKLDDLGVKYFSKTSGATGFHIYVPVERGYTYDQLRMFAEIIARLVATEHPKLVTQERTVSKRPAGRVMIDVSQNAYGRPLAAPYVVRAFPRAPVSAPVEARELKPSLAPERLNIKTVFDRIEKHGDLWAKFWKSAQRLEGATKKLGAHVPQRGKR